MGLPADSTTQELGIDPDCKRQTLIKIGQLQLTDPSFWTRLNRLFTKDSGALNELTHTLDKLSMHPWKNYSSCIHEAFPLVQQGWVLLNEAKTTQDTSDLYRLDFIKGQLYCYHAVCAEYLGTAPPQKVVEYLANAKRSFTKSNNDHHHFSSVKALDLLYNLHFLTEPFDLRQEGSTSIHAQMAEGHLLQATLFASENKWALCRKKLLKAKKQDPAARTYRLLEKTAENLEKADELLYLCHGSSIIIRDATRQRYHLLAAELTYKSVIFLQNGHLADLIDHSIFVKWMKSAHALVDKNLVFAKQEKKNYPDRHELPLYKYYLEKIETLYKSFNRDLKLSENINDISQK